MKMIERTVDANSWIPEGHRADPKSGKLFKHMEITFARAK
jgi:hypothetical protein